MFRADLFRTMYKNNIGARQRADKSRTELMRTIAGEIVTAVGKAMHASGHEKPPMSTDEAFLVLGIVAVNAVMLPGWADPTKSFGF